MNEIIGAAYSSEVGRSCRGKAATQSGARRPGFGAKRRGCQIDLRFLSASQFRLFFSHRLSFEVKFIDVVNEVVGNGLGQSGIANDLVCGQLTGSPSFVRRQWGEEE